VTIEYVKVTHVFRLEYKNDDGRKHALSLIGAAGGFGCSTNGGSYEARLCDVPAGVERSVLVRKRKVAK
jgi:hypothetical protein